MSGSHQIPLSYIAIFGKHSPTALGKLLAGKGLVKLCLCHMAIGFYLLGSSTEVYNEIVAWWSMVNSSWASSLRIKRWGAMAKSSREGGYSRWVRKGSGYFGLLTTLTVERVNTTLAPCRPELLPDIASICRTCIKTEAVCSLVPACVMGCPCIYVKCWKSVTCSRDTLNQCHPLLIAILLAAVI